MSLALKDHEDLNGHNVERGHFKGGKKVVAGVCMTVLEKKVSRQNCLKLNVYVGEKWPIYFILNVSSKTLLIVTSTTCVQKGSEIRFRL